MLKINWRRWEPTRFMLHHGPPHTRTHTVLYSYIKGWWEEKKQRDWGNIIVLLTSLLVIKVNHHLNRFEQTNTHTHTHAQIHTHRCCYYVGVWLIESITDTWCHTHTHTHAHCLILFQGFDGTQAGCKQAVNYPEAGTCSHLKSAEERVPRVLRWNCTQGGTQSPSTSLPPSLLLLRSYHSSTAALKGFSPIKHQRMRAPDRSSQSSTTQQMWNGLMGSPERWRAVWREEEEEEEEYSD